MGAGFRNIMLGLLVFLMVLTATLLLVTGTDTASTLMRPLLPLAVGFGVLWQAFKVFTGSGKGD